MQSQAQQTGEETSQQQQQTQNTSAVNIDHPTDGKTEIKWTKSGNAVQLEIRSTDGTTITTLRTVGQEMTITTEKFDIFARYRDGSTLLIRSSR
jgi:outer membrane biogenesis lipoprotein LolB